MKTKPEFGTTIRIRREVFGYTQRELAALVGVKAPISPIWKKGKGCRRLVYRFARPESSMFAPANSRFRPSRSWRSSASNNQKESSANVSLIQRYWKFIPIFESQEAATAPRLSDGCAARACGLEVSRKIRPLKKAGTRWFDHASLCTPSVASALGQDDL